jgi:predicted nucleotidyltransferase
MTNPGLVEQLAERLGEVPGVAAVVLGGSRARGEEDEESDIDLGLYYFADRPIDLDGLATLARELDDRHAGDLVTAPGEWGPWVNGGAWLTIAGHRVDWIYREIGRVASVIEDCRAGRVTCDYYLGHPHGFHNHIYVGEVHHCQPLFDPSHAIAALKTLTATYPPLMRETIIATYLYDARFMAGLARKPALRGDVFHVAGCLFRVAAALVQVLFALNERYFVNEKGALEATRTFPLAPPRFAATIESVLGRPGTAPAQLVASLERLQRLTAEVSALCSQPAR